MSEQTTSQSSTLTEKELQSIETFYRAFTDHNPDLLDGCALRTGRTSRSLQVRVQDRTD